MFSRIWILASYERILFGIICIFAIQLQINRSIYSSVMTSNLCLRIFVFCLCFVCLLLFQRQLNVTVHSSFITLITSLRRKGVVHVEFGKTILLGVYGLLVLGRSQFSLFFPPLHSQPETRLENWTPLSYSRGCGFWCLRNVPGEVEAGGADVFVGHDLLSAPGRSPALHPSTNYKLLLQPLIVKLTKCLTF